jgi:hypothetical protein
MSNDVLLLVFMIILVGSFIIAYVFRDKSKDEIRQQGFINSITGGPLDIEKKDDKTKE